ncbi:10240_t:CDS:2, partial [Gigaspora rosea]
ACIKILELDSKKDFNAKVAAIDFRTKKISIANIRPETLTEIQKFPIPIQKLIAEEAHAVSRRLQEGKKVPNLKMAKCSCKFFTHESGLEVYQSRQLVEVLLIQRSDAKKLQKKAGKL